MRNPGEKLPGFFLLGYAWRDMKEKPMRHLTYRIVVGGVLAGLILAAPAEAQPANAAPPQGQAAKDNKPPADQASGQSKPAPQGSASANAAPPAAKDDSIANYDVNGSNASDAMGTP
jgi:hypothetical protein